MNRVEKKFQCVSGRARSKIFCTMHTTRKIKSTHRPSAPINNRLPADAKGAREGNAETSSALDRMTVGGKNGGGGTMQEWASHNFNLHRPRHDTPDRERELHCATPTEQRQPFGHNTAGGSSCARPSGDWESGTQVAIFSPLMGVKILQQPGQYPAAKLAQSFSRAGVVLITSHPLNHQKLFVAATLSALDSDAQRLGAVWLGGLNGVNGWCYGFCSCMRSACEGWSQFWPKVLPIIRPQVFSGDSAAGCSLDARAFFNRDAPDLPISNCGHRHIQACCHSRSATHKAGSHVHRMLGCFVVYGLHLKMVTRNVLLNQHHVLTLFV